MTKKEAERDFRECTLPEIKVCFEEEGIKDYPARKEAWNNYTDRLCKDGRITQNQYDTWLSPACCHRPAKGE